MAQVSKIEVIAEHSVDLGILRSPANILDLGCRGFHFTEYFDKRGDYVVPFDCDPHLKTDRPYVKMAVSNYNGTASIKRTNDPQATSITKIITGGEEVATTTIDKICEDFKIPYWDLIKMDIEGAEHDVILSLNKAPAKQLSIEFHLHTGAYSKFQMSLMEIKLRALGYKSVKHDLTSQHGAGFNFWDSLWIHNA